MKNPKILIIGDYTNYQYHPFSGIAHTLEGLLSGRGLEPKFTEDRKELEPENLSQYDALITYVESWDQVLPSNQIQGILDFVASGRRIFGVHCGISYANPEYYELFGARFTNHPPLHEFPVKISGEKHPLTDGLADFRIEDELYMFDYKDFLQLKVLMEGDFEGKAYPLAWEKKAGAGALLYLALGHDQRAFGNEMFQKTLLNGALWAIPK
ncbi:MAG: ThuA domain-containing protein [Firmicutes bacterium]|nr:ThuA domain-containing protein [Bacillota bacterium]